MTQDAETTNPTRQARLACRMNQTEFGEAIGLGCGAAAQMAVSRLETGRGALELAVAHRIVRLCADHGVPRRLEDFIPADEAAA
jgi:hypothetical protein